MREHRCVCALGAEASCLSAREHQSGPVSVAWSGPWSGGQARGGARRVRTRCVERRMRSAGLHTCSPPLPGGTRCPRRPVPPRLPAPLPLPHGVRPRHPRTISASLAVMRLRGSSMSMRCSRPSALRSFRLERALAGGGGGSDSTRLKRFQTAGRGDGKEGAYREDSAGAGVVARTWKGRGSERGARRGHVNGGAAAVATQWRSQSADWARWSAHAGQFLWWAVGRATAAP